MYKNWMKLNYVIIEDKSGLTKNFSVPTHKFQIAKIQQLIEYIILEEKNDKIKKNEYANLSFDVRITAYILYITNFEKILADQYSKTISSLKNLGIKLNTEKYQRPIEKLKKDIENYTIWRNKVFAHTSFASPYSMNFPPKNICKNCKELWNTKREADKDNLSLQITSLEYFAGNYGGCDINRKYRILGGMHTIIDGEDPNQKLPVINIIKDYNATLKPHYKEWLNIFQNLIKDIKKNKKIILNKNPNIKNVSFK